VTDRCLRHGRRGLGGSGALVRDRSGPGGDDVDSGVFMVGKLAGAPAPFIFAAACLSGGSGALNAGLGRRFRGGGDFGSGGLP
jgi:hypothetical protein